MHRFLYLDLSLGLYTYPAWEPNLDHMCLSEIRPAIENPCQTRLRRYLYFLIALVPIADRYWTSKLHTWDPLQNSRVVGRFLGRVGPNS